MRRLLAGIALAATVVACGGGYAPDSAQQMIDDLSAAGVVDCADTRSPFPDVITCLDDDGDVTFALSDDGPARMATVGGDGPHLVGDAWVVLTFDNDLVRVEEMQDVLGGGAIWVRGEDDVLVPLDESRY